METIKAILMRRDDMSSEDADLLIEEAREDLMSRLEHDCDLINLDVEICMEYFGLEPDYIDQLI